MKFMKELEEIIDYMNIKVQINIARDYLINQQLEKIDNDITYALNKARKKVEGPK